MMMTIKKHKKKGLLNTVMPRKKKFKNIIIYNTKQKLTQAKE
jgi:hypothetical protein